MLGRRDPHVERSQTEEEEEQLQLALALSISDVDNQNQPMTDQERALFTSEPLKSTKRGHGEVPATQYAHRGSYYRDSLPPVSPVNPSPPPAIVPSSRRQQIQVNQGDLDRDLALALKLQDEEEQQHQQLLLQQRENKTTATEPKMMFGGGMNSFLCASCNMPMVGSVVSHDGKKYHAKCFRCAYCNQSIKGTFTLHSPLPPVCCNFYENDHFRCYHLFSLSLYLSIYLSIYLSWFTHIIIHHLLCSLSPLCSLSSLLGSGYVRHYLQSSHGHGPKAPISQRVCGDPFRSDLYTVS